MRRLPGSTDEFIQGSGCARLRLARIGLAAQPIERARTTATPIEHLIVVVGENLSFDNLFATYEPPPGETVGNLLSRGIVNRDGSPGPHFADAAQREARFAIAIGDARDHRHAARAAATRARPTRTACRATRPTRAFRPICRTDRSGSPSTSTYTAPVGDPVHRFFQMWQQVDGGRHDLFAWVAMTSGRRLAQPRRSRVGHQPGRRRHGLLQHGQRRRAVLPRARARPMRSPTTTTSR